MNDIKDVAKRIVEVYDTDADVARRVNESCEFFRALVYESGVVDCPVELDGTNEWNELMSELEHLMCDDKFDL